MDLAIMFIFAAFAGTDTIAGHFTELPTFPTFAMCEQSMEKSLERALPLVPEGRKLVAVCSDGQGHVRVRVSR